MNVLEAFINKFNQIIILILGLPCTNKSNYAKELSKDLNIQLIKINDFLIKDKYVEKIIDNNKFKLYEDVDNFDWDSFNKKINEIKSNGVIIYGNFLDINKINFDIDQIYFYSMNHNLCKKLLDEKKIFGNELNEEQKKIYFENIFVPLYDEFKQKLKINKFYNIKQDSEFNLIYDDLFDSVIKFIENKLYKK